MYRRAWVFLRNIFAFWYGEHGIGYDPSKGVELGPTNPDRLCELLDAPLTDKGRVEVRQQLPCCGAGVVVMWVLIAFLCITTPKLAGSGFIGHSRAASRRRTTNTASAAAATANTISLWLPFRFRGFGGGTQPRCRSALTVWDIPSMNERSLYLQQHT